MTLIAEVKAIIYRFEDQKNDVVATHREDQHFMPSVKVPWLTKTT